MDTEELRNKIAAIETAISAIASVLKEDDPDIFDQLLTQAMTGVADGKFPMAVWSSLDEMLGDG